MQGTLKLPAGFSWSSLTSGGRGELCAWLRAPLNLKQGDEIEIDVPVATAAAPTGAPRMIRAIGRIIAVAVHADGQLWYRFVAEATAAVEPEAAGTTKKQRI